MKNISVTIYTKEHGRLDLTYEEYLTFDFDKVTRHRTDSPASIWYYQDGSIEREYYFINDKMHRIDGPAESWYDKDGSIEREYYYINNKFYNKEDYDNLINEMKSLPKSLKLTHQEQWVREL